MDALRETQQTIHGALRGEIPVESAALELGCDPRRLTLYRDFVRGHVVSVVEKNHPMTWRMLGERAPDLARAYALAHPPSSWEMNRASEHFAEFLEAREGVPPFLAALARFEWECFAAYVDPARIPAPATIDAPTVNPTVRALVFDVPIVRWVLDYDAERDPGEMGLPEPLETPETVLIFRRPEREITAYYRASDDLLFALKVAFEAIPIEEAAAATRRSVETCQSLLERAAEIGLILLPAA